MILLKIKYKNRSFSHLVFAEVISTEQMISIAEQVTKTTCTKYCTSRSLMYIDKDDEDVTVNFEYISSFCFLTFPADNSKIIKLKEELGMETLEEVLHYIISLH